MRKPGAPPSGFSSGCEPRGSAAHRAAYSGSPRKRARRSSARSGTSSCGTSNAAAIASRVAEGSGRIVGTVEAGLNFFGSGDVAVLGVRVDPARRNEGIGSALYELGIEHVRSLGVSQLTTMFEESEAGVSFATHRGWNEVRAETLSVLDPRSVLQRPDPAVELVPARDLDPHELHRIDEEATRDMPAFEALTEIVYDEWLDFVWDNPLFTREGSFGAVVDGHVVAVTLLLVNTDIGRAVNMFTGTTREHRGR